MPKNKSAIRYIFRNMKNKKEDEKRKKTFKQMNFDVAVPRAPAASVAKNRRKLKRKRDAEQQPEEEEEEVIELPKDYAPPKKAAAMKRQLEQYETSKTTTKRSKKISEEGGVVAIRSGGDVKAVANRGDIKVESVLGIIDCDLPSPQHQDNKERDIQHRIRTLLANLAKASREKALPTASTLELRHGGKNNKKEKHHAPAFKNVGSDIVKVCLSQPVWALVHRRDFKRGFDEWFENSDNLIRLLNNGNAENINAAMKTAVTKQINDAIKERVYFEMLSNVCNDLFKTLVLPNKKFDKNFATIATDNTDPTVRSLSIPKYFRALNENVWQKITDTMDILLTGGGSGDQSAISQLEACAQNIINRATSRPVEATIKKAVEQANQAHKLSTGAFIPTTNKKPPGGGGLQGSPFFNPGYYDPYYHCLERGANCIMST
uniref:Wsv161-like protein n=1 Tax=Sesarmops intermedium nimavirus TaxID=2133796 RepID=A0A401IPP3_9VIRU|nr:wsv161-like protein [Sesarmops intermedium nimavirus]